MDAETKQALLKAGLLSDSENDLSSQKKEKPVSTEIGEHSQGVPSPITGTQNMQNSKFNEQQSQPAGREEEIPENIANDMAISMKPLEEVLTNTDKGLVISDVGVDNTQKVIDAQVKESGVVTTPTKNRFDVLDTENELNQAYQNLQRDKANKMALIMIPEDKPQSYRQ